MPAQALSDPSLPHIDRTGVHPALIVEGKPFLMLGAQVNNSSAWPATLPDVWPVLDKLGANTVEAPVYWETLEPREHTFDFAQVDAILQGARAHNKRVVLLWFGTWKNGSPGYVPAWVKCDRQRFPLAVDAKGVPLFSLSPFAEATLQADQSAFAALMLHLKETDTQHTVLMVQVENEAGLWGGSRDYSAAANRLFAQAVPDQVLTAMGKPGQHGNWAEIFGVDADSTFTPGPSPATSSR